MKAKALLKKLSKHLKISLGMYHDLIEVKGCPICRGTSLTKSFIHKEWLKQCYTCSECMHSFLPDTNNIVPAGYFKTYKPRVEFYLKVIKELQINSLLEVGTPDDFHFLNELHRVRPDIKLYGFDIFGKKNVPPYINMVSDSAAVNVDLVYATHVLEHFEHPKKLVDMIREMGCKFLIEVPNCPPLYANLIRQTRIGTGYHYHFFNVYSLDKLLREGGVDATTFVRRDNNVKRNVRGSIVSSNIDIEWKNHIHPNYQVIDRYKAN